MAACLAGAAFGAHADELAEVQRLHRAGDTAAAMQRADRFLAVDPRHAAMRFVKGVLLAEQKRNPEAIAWLQKLSDDFPDLAEPHNNLAALHAANGDYPKARTALEQAVRLSPDYATAHENLGDVQAALAARSYARALQLEPASSTVPPKLALARELAQRPAGR